MVENETIDVFHRGRFYLVQPSRQGYRAGIDAMILASCVPNRFKGRLADLGSGTGAAGFAVVSRCPMVKQITLVENSSFMLSFAKKTLTHPYNAAFRKKMSILEADVTLSGRARNEAGLINNSFDFVIMNPPFNSQADTPTSDNEKARAHVMYEGLFDSWLRTAAAIVNSKGSVGLISRPSFIAEILVALKGRFGGLRVVPIYPRRSQAAIRIIIIAKKASCSALQIMPPLVLHEEKSNTFTLQADGINSGYSSLWDTIKS
ncbi:MAG: Methyltransferase [Candidatus Tokpelaia sp. JSC188]|nr:MAG: Methyltransferase [Candidatus Tokpelaia sp. JSC188]